MRPDNHGPQPQIWPALFDRSTEDVVYSRVVRTRRRTFSVPKPCGLDFGPPPSQDEIVQRATKLDGLVQKVRHHVERPAD